MNKETVKKVIIPILISTLIVTILQNFKLIPYNKYFILPIMLLIITDIYLLDKNKMIINNKAYRLLIPIILIILGSVLFKIDISNKILNIIILPILISLFLLSLTNKHFKISGKFLNWVVKIFPAKLFTNLGAIKNTVTITNDKKKKSFHIFLGVLLGIPIVYVILILLSSADLYFGAFINKLMNGLGRLLLNFRFLKNNILVFISYFIILFSTLINVFKNKDSNVPTGKIRNIETAIFNTILIMMNFVFLLFVVSEISKICGNFLQLPEAYTYSAYAREGFFQLLMVTIINFTMILFLLYKTDKLEKNKLLKYSVLCLIIFTIILIFNSYYRMFLYINRFGFTILRMQVILFLLMELIISLIIIKKIMANLKYRDANTFMNVIVSTYVINIFICNSNVINLLNRIINK